MPTSEVVYKGDLRTVSTHLASGESIITDAPVDNHGRGEAFSPTDLLANSLGTCMLTVVGIAAATHGFTIDGARVIITKIMAPDPPRRVGQIKAAVYLPEIEYSESQQRIIEKIALTCPVALSLHPDIKQEITFHYHEFHAS